MTEVQKFSEPESDHSASEDDNILTQSPCFDNEYKERPQEQLQSRIIDEILSKDNKIDTFSVGVENRLKQLLDKIPRNNDEEALTVRMHELALSKILVFTHGKSDFKLVQAHHHIGEAYLNYKCYEQAIDHLTLALKKNSKLFQIKYTKLYYSYMLTTLSRCYFQISSYLDALEYLNKAEEIQKTYKSSQIYRHNIQTLELIAKCQLKLKNYKLALQYIDNTLDLIIGIYGESSKEFAISNALKSKIYSEQGNLLKGIEELKHSISIFHKIDYKNKEEIANMYQIMAQYQETFGDFEKEIQALKSKYKIYQDLYGNQDKKSIKAQKNIALTYLKRQKYQEALTQLLSLLGVEESLYGDSSIQVGKTMKILGTVQMSMKNLSQAQKYLKKGQKILHEHGQTKLVKQIKSKLVILKEMREERK